VTKEKIKDVVTRAFKTFIQAFIGSITIDGFFGVTDFDAIKRIALSMLVAGVAAGVSAVWNMILDFVYRKIDEAMPTEEELAKSIEEGLGLEDDEI
jgi:phosphotransferase system  glucose/maltose/N-acetylglucosamine-specific IIC component